MPTLLFHVTSAERAFGILDKGIYVPSSRPGDICLNMYWQDKDGRLRSRPSPATRYGGYGVSLDLEWNGPEEEITDSSHAYAPNVLYHQTPLGSDIYWRSFVLPGTTKHLKVTGLTIGEAMTDDWAEGKMPSALMGPWRFAPTWIRNKFCNYGTTRVENYLSGMLGLNGKALVVSSTKMLDD